MKAFVSVEPYDLSKAMHRTADALAQYALPEVQITSRRENADLVVRYVIGFPETETAVANAKASGQEIALIQCCLKSTQEPNVEKWQPLWAQAKLVASYYDLPCERFYYAPLGVDGAIFHPNGATRRYRLGTSGYVAESEAVNECAEAVRRLGAKQFHLGPKLVESENCITAIGLDDEGVADAWAHCEYVSGLRRIEGFELPAAEGLACGARPILFDRDEHRQWFNEWAVYVPECEPAELTERLTEVLAQPARPVSDAERAAVLERFNWQTFALGFWERVL